MSSSQNDVDPSEESWRVIGAAFFSPNHANLGYRKYPDQWPFIADVETTFDFSKTNKVTLITLGDQITAFINGQIIYSVQNPVGSAIHKRQQLSASGQNKCEYDNYKYWDLSGVDFSAAKTPSPTLDPAIQIALDTIQNEEPIYQISFDFSWDRENYNNADAGTRIDDGKLIVIGEDQKENRGYLNLPPAIQVSDIFAVEFEFRILESTPVGRCGLVNWGETRGIIVSFLPQGQVELYGSVLRDVARGNFDVSKTNMFTLISLGDQFAGLINGQFAGTINKPEGTNNYGESFFNTTDVITCEFDNYKIWDLSGVDLNP